MGFLGVPSLKTMDSKSKSAKKPFDPVVKIGLTVLIGGFILIAGGMFLSRPDRTIPPYSNGWQEDKVVAVHVPAWTSDPEIETLIRRFQNVGLAQQDFRGMKIRPTTPEKTSNANFVQNTPEFCIQIQRKYIFTLQTIQYVLK